MMVSGWTAGGRVTSVVSAEAASPVSPRAAITSGPTEVRIGRGDSADTATSTGINPAKACAASASARSYPLIAIMRRHTRATSPPSWRATTTPTRWRVLLTPVCTRPPSGTSSPCPGQRGPRRRAPASPAADETRWGGIICYR